MFKGVKWIIFAKYIKLKTFFPMSRYHDNQIKDKLIIKHIIKQTTITTNMTHLQNDAFQAALDSGELFNLDFQFSDAEEWTEPGVRTSGKYASNDAPSWDDYDRRQRRWMEEEDEMDRRHRATQSVARLQWDHERKDKWIWNSVMAKNHMVRCFEQELGEPLTLTYMLTIGCNV